MLLYDMDQGGGGHVNCIVQRAVSYLAIRFVWRPCSSVQRRLAATPTVTVAFPSTFSFDIFVQIPQPTKLFLYFQQSGIGWQVKTLKFLIRVSFPLCLRPIFT